METRMDAKNFAARPMTVLSKPNIGISLRERPLFLNANGFGWKGSSGSDL
jgi:hypothetical protein